MKYFAYIRKSSEDKKRQIQSIPKQYHWCKREAERRNIKIVRFFEDSSSGHKLNRLGFKEMIDTIEASKEPIGIVTWKISRLARNPIDEGVIKYAFMRKKIKHIIARDREYREGESQIIMGVDFGQATQYSIELSKDVIEGMSKKVSNGYRPAKAPYGYLNDPYGRKGEKKMFTDKKYFKPIQRFLNAYLTGIYSVPELRTKMTEEWGILARNGKPFSNSSLYAILVKRFYCGEFLWNGTIRKGKHKPMISVKQHEKILTLLGRQTRPHVNLHQNYYSGFISCHHCQSAITGYSKTKNNRIKGFTTYHYLKCGKKKSKSCPQVHLTRSNADAQIILLLENLFIPQKMIDFIMNRIEYEKRERFVTDTHLLGELNRKQNELESEIETLGRKLTRGIISDEIFAKMNSALEQEYDIVLQKTKSLQSNKFDKRNLLRAFEFLNNAPEKFKYGSYEEKKEVLQTIGSNFYLNDGILSIELAKGFKLLQDAKKYFHQENRWIEPKFTRSTSSLKPFSNKMITGWSSCWDKIRTYFTENIILIPKH